MNFLKEHRDLQVENTKMLQDWCALIETSMHKDLNSVMTIIMDELRFACDSLSTQEETKVKMAQRVSSVLLSEISDNNNCIGLIVRITCSVAAIIF